MQHKLCVYQHLNHSDAKNEIRVLNRH